MIWIKLDSEITDRSDSLTMTKLLCDLFWSPNPSFPRYSVFIDISSLSQNSRLKRILESEPILKSLVESQFDDYINNGVRYDYLIDDSGNNYNVDEAIRTFGAPVQIILENSKNDAEFVRAIMTHFDGFERFKCYLDNGWVTFENAGGCQNVSNLIQGKLNALQEFASRYNSNPEKYFRGFVLLDGDKSHSDEQVTKYSTVVERLNNWKVAYHITEKRAMENYMPEAVYNEIKAAYSANGVTEWVNAYNHLTNVAQKDFLNIPDGFKMDSEGNVLPLPPSVANLFNIGDSNLKYLGKGLRIPNFKDSFPRYFSISTHVYKASLMSRCGNNELEEIRDKINALI